MNQSQKVLKEFKKFLKLAHNINAYNIRTHALRKLRYDFENILKKKDFNEELFNNLKLDYDKLNRIVLVQNINVPYEDFKYKNVVANII